ncbi:MAG: hypothetical protein ABSB10_04615 [Candidatus Bathyarchaeia archaeon]|jgi:hypothetical protein
MSENGAAKEKTIELLEELVKWTKVTSIPQVRDILEKNLKTPKERVLYKFSDGKKTTKELSDISGIYSGDISNLWKKWTREGIAEQIPSQGGSRGNSLFSLEDFGIDVPSISQKTKSKNVTEEQRKDLQNSEVK